MEHSAYSHNLHRNLNITRYYYLLKLRYKGTQYFGWQEQKNNSIVELATDKTVQAELMRALEQVCQSKEIKTMGSGRTDAGVHALAQIVKVQLPRPLPLKALILGVNAFLPQDIRVLEAKDCSAEFMPTVDSLWKEYNYLFYSGPYINPFCQDLMTHFPFKIDLSTFEKMQKACQLFIGEHDFCNFYCMGTNVKTTVRTIFDCQLVLENSQEQCPGTHFSKIFPNYYVFKVIGSGFLKQMVRLMVGAIWSVARGSTTMDELEYTLKSGHKVMKKLGQVAPANGLYLMHVEYDKEYWQA